MRIEALKACFRRYIRSKPGAADSTHRRRTYGQSLVEFALISPVFLMMVLGVIDLGRAFYTYEALANAAREGARYCALHAQDTYADDPAQGTLDRVTNELDGTVASVTVSSSPSCTPNDTTAGEPVTVTASTTFTPVTPLIAGLMPGGSLTISASAKMMVQ